MRYTKLFSGIFIIIFMSAAAFMAGLHVHKATSKTENPTLKNIMDGTWAPTFESELNESLPVFSPARNFWGRAEYEAFGEGRSGVLVGKDGWLFTNEEFSCVPGGEQNMQQNLDYIQHVFNHLKQNGTHLEIVLLPAKARLYKDYLGDNTMPECREKLYGRVVRYFKDNDIGYVSLLEPFARFPQRDKLFFKTDTHWTPAGAKLTALLIAQLYEGFDLSEKEYVTEYDEPVEHEGDLLRYLPGVENDTIHTEMIGSMETNAAEENADAAAALFGDEDVPVTLVGTSYSANQNWHFEGHLKDALNVDVLNMADEGQGPFKTMASYLASDALKNNPPLIVLWEIPERYVTVSFNMEN